MRIGVGGFHIESCTFSPQLSRGEDFSIRSGDLLLRSYPFLSAYRDVDFAPLIYARALPGGPVMRSFYDGVKAQFLQKMRDEGGLDGLFLHMHGAANVAGMDDAEGDFLSSVRELAGRDCLIAVSYDLHGNVSQPVFEAVDVLSAYRTAPHVDCSETLERVSALLVGCLKDKKRLCKAWIRVPVLLPGEKTSTEHEPARSLYKQIPALIADQAVVDASILVGYAWADEPRSSAAIIALDPDQNKALAAARLLGQRFWAARAAFDFGVVTGSVDQCLEIAMNAPERPVVISDSGDNPTAGGVGDNTYLLERMLVVGVKDAVFASVVDPEGLAVCATAGLNAEVQLLLGGKLDSVNGKPLLVKGRVISLHERARDMAESHSAGLNRMAVIDVQGIHVIVTEQRTPFHRIRDFEDLSIEPARHKIVVVKIGYLEPELKTFAAKALLALSPGAVNQDLLRLPFHRVRRPMYPFDPEMTWSPNESEAVNCRN